MGTTFGTIASTHSIAAKAVEILKQTNIHHNTYNKSIPLVILRYKIEAIQEHRLYSHVFIFQRHEN